MSVKLTEPVACSLATVAISVMGLPAITAVCEAVSKIVVAFLLTATTPLVPVVAEVVVSVAAMVCEPAVFSIAEKVPTPLVSVASAGSAAAASVLVKCTVPA